MKKVFVSGCYDVLHGGHLEFFQQAKALGDHLIVCLPSDAALLLHKDRKPWIPLAHKSHLIAALEPVDEVVLGDDPEPGMNFRSQFMKIRPDVLAVTEDDEFEGPKRALCASTGAAYVSLPKSLAYEKISSTEIVENARAATRAPLRVDFAGGWLDVPRLARSGTFIVNCAISPLVTLSDWPYETCSGIGGSGAYALLQGRDGIASELENNVGWQDPAVIMETGLCVWRSGERPVLEAKINPSFLSGRMALYWSGETHVTASLADVDRDYDLLARGSEVARDAALAMDLDRLCEAIGMTYAVQLKEGMQDLPDLGERARKYCGSGHGGYAVYLFDARPEREDFIPVEPYMERFKA